MKTVEKLMKMVLALSLIGLLLLPVNSVCTINANAIDATVPSEDTSLFVNADFSEDIGP